jgi:hypothetical protein
MDAREKQCRLWVAWKLTKGSQSIDELIESATQRNGNPHRFTGNEIRSTIGQMIEDQRRK